MPFPKGFRWGTATAAFQIEGSTHIDGRGESIWDRFVASPGAVARGDDASIANDSYVRWRDDIALLGDLGLNAYRFSVSWPRVQPAGTGPVNAAGLDYYDRLVDGLLAAGIEPWVTLFHWDLPQALQDSGGWLNRATIDAFASYTEAVVRRLGDRVSHWITLNEPGIFSNCGHRLGVHAPGQRSAEAAAAVSHHLLLGHAAAVQAIRVHRPLAHVGVTLYLVPTIDQDGSGAARRYDGAMNRLYLDPVFGRGYPEDMIASLPGLAAAVWPTDVIDAPIDFLGINFYGPHWIHQAPGEWLDLDIDRSDIVARTSMGSAIVPDALTDLLVHIHEEYAPLAIFITESGASFDDPDPVDGVIPDLRRVRYLHDHFLAAERAIARGVPLGGYFVWSLLDNFEWAEGYAMRFGVATRGRQVKASGAYLRRVARANAVPSVHG